MKQLYAPWRDKYTTNSSENSKTDKASSCVFCDQAKDTKSDAHNFIIKRFDHCFVMLNLYPYNPGHLLVIPYTHTHSITELAPHIRHELIEVVSQSMTVLEKTLNAHGINFGANIGGKAAGGTIPEHVHLHVVPRYVGDTNFLVTMAHTKQISANIAEIYEKLCADWA